MTTAHPSYDELAALPAYATRAVPTAFEDINGHLNIRHYVGIASEGLDESLLDVGIPQNWPTVAGQGVFTAEHHMTYLSELRTGDKISVRVRVIGRSARAAHVVAYLLDDTHQKVSYVMEEIFLHIDMDEPAQRGLARGRRRRDRPARRRRRRAALEARAVGLDVPALSADARESRIGLNPTGPARHLGADPGGLRPPGR